MPDEVTNWELARRLDSMQGTLSRLRDDVVGRPEWSVEMRNIDRRFLQIDRDLEDIRAQHAKDVGELQNRISEETRRAIEQRQSWRTIVWTGLIPAMVVLIGVLVQLWIGSRGR